MDGDKVKFLLADLGSYLVTIRTLESHAAISETAGACERSADELSLELGSLPRLGPLLYSLRSIFSQMAETRAMVDIPRLVEWAETVLARITRELSQPEQPAEASPAVPSIPEGAREFVIFESLARPGYRVACYHMGIGNELFGLDEKPRVPPDPTKWKVAAYFDLPAGLDLIPPAALSLPGDDGQPDWSAAPPAPAAASESEATAAVESAPVGESQPAAEQNQGE